MCPRHWIATTNDLPSPARDEAVRHRVRRPFETPIRPPAHLATLPIVGWCAYWMFLPVPAGAGVHRFGAPISRSAPPRPASVRSGVPPAPFSDRNRGSDATAGPSPQGCRALPPSVFSDLLLAVTPRLVAGISRPIPHVTVQCNRNPRAAARPGRLANGTATRPKNRGICPNSRRPWPIRATLASSGGRCTSASGRAGARRRASHANRRSDAAARPR